MASQVLRTISRDEEERARIMRDEKILLDYYSGINYMKKKGLSEGIEIGEQRGIQIGTDKGIQIGTDKGIQIGIEKRDKEIALKMKKAGKPFSEITEFTGLSPETIATL